MDFLFRLDSVFIYDPTLLPILKKPIETDY